MVHFMLQLSASLVVVFYFLCNCAMTAAPKILLKVPSVYLAWTISDCYIPPVWEEGKKVLQSQMEQDSVRSCFAKFQRETFS